MKLEDKIPNINKYLKEGFEYIKPHESLKPCLSVPDIVLKYGNVSGKFKTIPFMGHYMVGCINQVMKSYRNMHNAPDKTKTKISESELYDLKAYIKSLGINEIGFTKVDSSHIFSNRKIMHQNAIVLIMEMKKDIINTAPSIKANKEIFRTYYQLGYAANKIKEHLNKLGFSAQAGPALGGEAHYPSLAQKAGMGYIGKHGLLITPQHGASLRIGAVYTNIDNLPYTDNDDHVWINDFCTSCLRCVKKCPAQAIYNENKIDENGFFECIDYKKCAVPFSNNYGCTVCVKECTFTKSQYNKIYSIFYKNK